MAINPTASPSITPAPPTMTAPATLVITPTPYRLPPTVTAPPSACTEAPRPTRLTVMERGRVSDENESTTSELVNVRSGPGTGNRVIDQMAIGEVFLVLDGPECSTSYAWFQIRYNETVGWIAEGDIDAYFVEPFLSE